MKRLLNIIRHHRPDNDLKPLEDLWDLCNTPPPPPPPPPPPAPAPQPQTQPVSPNQRAVSPPGNENSTTVKTTGGGLKRDASKLALSTTSITGGSDKPESKKARLQQPTPPPTTTIKTTTTTSPTKPTSPRSVVENESLSVNKNGSSENKKRESSLNSISEIRFSDGSSQPVVLNTQAAAASADVVNLVTDFSTDLDMLDFSCSICKYVFQIFVFPKFIYLNIF